LKHNNIINVINVAVGEEAMDEVYMVMEYAEQVGSPMLRVRT
jgi:cyclin-dependent kinase 10